MKARFEPGDMICYIYAGYQCAAIIAGVHGDRLTCSAACCETGPHVGEGWKRYDPPALISVTLDEAYPHDDADRAWASYIAAQLNGE